MCRVVISAEIGVYVDGLSLALADQDEIEVAGSATDALGTLRVVRERRPDVLLLDMQMPAAFSLLRAIAGEESGVHVLALAIEETEDLVIACAEAGVAGYVPRDATVAQVAEIARDVTRGEAACSPRIVARLLHRMAILASDRPGRPRRWAA